MQWYVTLQMSLVVYRNLLAGAKPSSRFSRASSAACLSPLRPQSRDSSSHYGGGGRGERSTGGAPEPALRSGVPPLRPQVLPGHQLQQAQVPRRQLRLRGLQKLRPPARSPRVRESRDEAAYWWSTWFLRIRRRSTLMPFPWKLLGSFVWSISYHFQKWLLQMTTLNSSLTCCEGKQRLLYNSLDAIQSLTSQAVVIGVSCRLDADQLLEKRVRSRFSHRKLLFVPSSLEDTQRLVKNLLMLAKDLGLPAKYITDYNSRLTNIFDDKKFKGILNSLMDADATTSNILRFLFRAVSYMGMESGFLSMESFLKAFSSMQRQPKMDSLQEYRSIQDAYKTCDKYASTVCFRAFEHLLDRELISFGESRGMNQALEYRPVKLLISSRELAQSLKLNTCPAVLQKLFDRERYM